METKTTDIKKWNIWIEGYSATGQNSRADFKGSFEGKTFKEACITWVATLDDNNKQYFSEETLTYWACKMFDNEVEARKSFG